MTDCNQGRNCPAIKGGDCHCAQTPPDGTAFTTFDLFLAAICLVGALYVGLSFVIRWWLK